jgi:hypothetical protein
MVFAAAPFELAPCGSAGEAPRLCDDSQRVKSFSTKAVDFLRA